MKNRRLDQILDAATLLFKEKGFDEVSVMEICEVCQITKPTFYKYVDSKEELLRAYYDNALAQLLANLDAAMENDYYGKIWTGLTSTMEKTLALGPELAAKYLALNLKSHTPTARYTSDGMKRTVENIRLAQQTGQIRNTSNPDELYLSLRNAGLAYNLKWCMNKGGFDCLEAFRNILETVLLPDFKVIEEQTGIHDRV